MCGARPGPHDAAMVNDDNRVDITTVDPPAGRLRRDLIRRCNATAPGRTEAGDDRVGEVVVRWRSVAVLGVVANVLVVIASVPAAEAVLRSPTVLPVATPTLDADALFGESVDGIGDVNGDGVSDAAVGAPGDVIRRIGDPDGLTGKRFGWAVAGVGDVDGDGVEDIGVGAPSDPGFLPVPCPPDEEDCPDTRGTR